MAEETGSARQEAERLVATVLAMTSQASDDTLAATADRIVNGLGQVGATLAGFVSRATEAATDAGNDAAESRAAESRAGEPKAAESKAAEARTAESEAAGEKEPGAPAGDAWARATAGPAPADEGDPWAWATGAVRRVVGHGGDDQAGTHVSYGWSTGSVECCVCPVCRMIASMRNPTPESAERLATGAGDFATGVVSLMRAFSAMSGTRSRPARRTATPPPPPDPDLAWSAATRRGYAPVAEPTTDDQSPWTAATRAANREAAEREAAAKAERDRVARERAALQRERGAKQREEAARQREEATAGGARPAETSTGAARPAENNAGAARPAETGAGSARPAESSAGGDGRREEAARPWGWGGDRSGDVWARATADPGVGHAAGEPTVDHDDAGDAAQQ